MRSSPFGRLLRSKSIRVPAIALAMACALNMSGCHGGRRTSMRPRFFSGSTRSQSVMIEQGYTAVETPGAAIVQQQGSAIVQQQQGAEVNTVTEPPITLEPRQGGTTSTIVPSFGDAQQPIGSPSSSGTTNATPSYGNSPRSVIDSLAPPAEAPQAIMEAPPVSNLDKPATPSSPSDSTNRRSEPAAGDEPRLEVIPPGTTPGSGGPSTPSGSGGSQPGASKTSAWRTEKPSSTSGRTTYQASTRKTLDSGSQRSSVGVLD